VVERADASGSDRRDGRVAALDRVVDEVPLLARLVPSGIVVAVRPLQRVSAC
jgi:hypothetical protein